MLPSLTVEPEIVPSRKTHTQHSYVTNDGKLLLTSENDCHLKVEICSLFKIWFKIHWLKVAPFSVVWWIFMKKKFLMNISYAKIMWALANNLFRAFLEKNHKRLVWFLWCLCSSAIFCHFTCYFHSLLNRFENYTFQEVEWTNYPTSLYCYLSSFVFQFAFKLPAFLEMNCSKSSRNILSSWLTTRGSCWIPWVPQRAWRAENTSSFSWYKNARCFSHCSLSL